MSGFIIVSDIDSDIYDDIIMIYSNINGFMFNEMSKYIFFIEILFIFETVFLILTIS